MKRRFIPFFVFGLSILILAGVSGCGGSDVSAPPSASPSSAVERDGPVDTPVAEPEESPTRFPETGLRDDGDPYREHRYRLSPGEEAVLVFEKRLSRRPEPGEISPRVVRDEWEPFGAGAMVDKAVIVTRQVDGTRWGIDFQGSGFILTPGGEPVMHLRNPQAQGITGMKWLRDSVYTISEINGRRWPEQSLSKLTESRLLEICGDAAVFVFRDPDTERDMEFPLEPIRVGGEVTLAQVEVVVNLPQEVSESINGKEIRFEFSRFGRLSLRLAFNPRTSRFFTMFSIVLGWKKICACLALLTPLEISFL